MALSHEDYKDIKSAKGKALADKVKKVTIDHPRSSEAEHKSGTFKRVGKVGGNPLAPIFRYKEPSIEESAARLNMKHSRNPETIKKAQNEFRFNKGRWNKHGQTRADVKEMNRVDKPESGGADHNWGRHL